MRRTLLTMVVCVLASVLTLAVSSGPGGVARAATNPPFPKYDRVFLVIDENHNANQIINNPAAPDINALATDYGLAAGYTGVSDPSEPNYVAMLGGSDLGISSDDPYFWPGHTVSAPNLIDDMHDGTINQGDTWLSRNLPAIFSSNSYTNGSTAVILTWDEGEGGTVSDCALNTTDIGCHVATIVVNPSTPVGSTSGTLFNHYSLLGTTEELLGLPKLGLAASNTTMTSAFNLQRVHPSRHRAVRQINRRAALVRFAKEALAAIPALRCPSRCRPAVSEF